MCSTPIMPLPMMPYLSVVTNPPRCRVRIDVSAYIRVVSIGAVTHSLVNTSPRPLPGGLDPIGPLGFGTWRFTTDDLAAAQGLVETALELGMNLIDTADVYGLDWGGTAFGSGEELLGQVLNDAPALRDRMVLASKGGIIPGVPYDSAYLETACEDSLRRLGVEQLDLYLIHRPDMLTHPEETARVLQNLKQSGKVRTLGYLTICRARLKR